MPKDLRNLLSTTAGILVAASVFSTTPYQIRFDVGTGFVTLADSFAMAKDSDDDDGDDDRDQSREREREREKQDAERDREREKQDAERNREREKQDAEREREREKQDAERERERETERGEDRSGRDDGDDDGDRGRSRDRGRDGHDDDSLEVTLSDGSRIEIEDGRFERKDASGRTIEERPARRSDYAKLQQAGTASGGSQRRSPGGTFRGGGTVSSYEVSGRDIEVTYTDGWKEEIENGRYELKDARNRTVIERAARQSDASRLFKAAR